MKLKVLNEIKIGRVWKLVQDPKYDFGVVSAEREEYSPEENEARWGQLYKEIHGRYGYVHLLGGQWKKIAGEEKEVTEPSFLVHGITKKDLIKMGLDYEQDSVLYKNKDGFEILSTSPASPTSIGTVLGEFKFGEDGDTLTFAVDAIKSYYSRLKYGKHKNKKFSFIFKEQVSKNWMSRMGRLDPSWETIYKEK